MPGGWELPRCKIFSIILLMPGLLPIINVEVWRGSGRRWKMLFELYTLIIIALCVWCNTYIFRFQLFPRFLMYFTFKSFYILRHFTPFTYSTFFVLYYERRAWFFHKTIMCMVLLIEIHFMTLTKMKFFCLSIFY